MNTPSNNLTKIHAQAKDLPQLPGVYLFKDEHNQILYIGKAKNLKKRVLSYFKKNETDFKSHIITSASFTIDHIVTKNELEAMLLEAQLIQSNQPKFNILLKSGQPFLYLLITSPQRKLPEIKLVRTKKEKGTYFGPFLEKTPARKVYNFITRTFKLTLCKQKMESGCLQYHIGNCAGNCRTDFNKEEYLKRLNLAKIALQQGHKKFLKHLGLEIEKSNTAMEFEKSKELHEYYKAFERVFEVLDTTNYPNSSTRTLAQKDIWILAEDKKTLFLFSEHNAAIKKKRFFYLWSVALAKDYFTMAGTNDYLDHFLGYYRSFSCPNTILVNFELDKNDKELYEKFLKKWHKKDYDVSIINPKDGYFLSLIKLATIHMQEEIKKQKTLAKSLKKFLKLENEPHIIDCFDISHKQGMFQVGSCVRFKDGEPDKNNFRKFKIKTVEQQDDYACLQEIVERRYSDEKDIPDLILIDGGKGQLSSVLHVLPNAQVISLAKKEETIFSENLPEGKKLNEHDFVGQVLIALRDYAHHFAISYHRKLSKIKK